MIKKIAAILLLSFCFTITSCNKEKDPPECGKECMCPDAECENPDENCNCPEPGCPNAGCENPDENCNCPEPGCPNAECENPDDNCECSPEVCSCHEGCVCLKGECKCKNNDCLGPGPFNMHEFLNQRLSACTWKNDAPSFINLSFDDTDPSHLKIARLLSEYSLTGTFYINGRNPEAIQEVYREIIGMGHEVGNHTTNHKQLDIMEYDLLYSQIVGCKEYLEETYDIKVLSFATPFHLSSKNVKKIVLENGMFMRNESEYFENERKRCEVQTPTLVEKVSQYVDKQMENGQMCLINGHGIDGEGWSPCTTEFFREVFSIIRQQVEDKGAWIGHFYEGALYESLFHEVRIAHEVNEDLSTVAIGFEYRQKPIYNRFDKLEFSFKIEKIAGLKLTLHEDSSNITENHTATHFVYTLDLMQTDRVFITFELPAKR